MASQKNSKCFIVRAVSFQYLFLNSSIAVLSFPDHCYCINIPILRGVYELKLRTYEKMGITVVVLNQTTLNGLQNDEKIPYLQREVRLKLSQRQSVSVKC